MFKNLTLLSDSLFMEVDPSFAGLLSVQSFFLGRTITPKEHKVRQFFSRSPEACFADWYGYIFFCLIINFVPFVTLHFEPDCVK